MPMPGKARRSFLTFCAHVDEGCRAFCVCHVFLKRKADEKLGRLHPLRAYDRPIVQCFRMGLSQDYRYQTEAPPTYALMCRRQMHRLVPAASEGPTFSGMEVEIDMTGKIAAIVAAVVLIASAWVASAQPKRHVPRTDQWQAPYAKRRCRTRILTTIGTIGRVSIPPAGPSRVTPSLELCSRA